MRIDEILPSLFEEHTFHRQNLNPSVNKKITQNIDVPTARTFPS